MNSQISISIVAWAAISAAACVMPRAADVTGEQSQLEIRQIQTREYQATDKRMALRSTIATLQDLGFVIDDADLELGTVTATRHRGQTMRMTVTTRERSGERVAIRANARLGEGGIDDAQTYQDFFVALDKAMFLTLQRVD